MTTYSEATEVFLNEHTGSISRELAENIIAQYGGEENFILNRDAFIDGDIWSVGAWTGYWVRHEFFIANKKEIIKTVNKEREIAGKYWYARYLDAAMVDGGGAEYAAHLIDSDSIEKEGNFIQGLSLYVAALMARTYYYYTLDFNLELPKTLEPPLGWGEIY